MCERRDKSVTHLIVTRDLTMSDWYEIFGWLGLCFILHRDLNYILLVIRSLDGSSRARCGLVMI